MDTMHQTTDAMMAIAQEAIPSVQAAYLKRFGVSIDVTAHKVQNEANGSSIEFSFRPSKAGLLPTVAERSFFEGYFAGFQRCHFLVCNIMMADQQPN